MNLLPALATTSHSHIADLFTKPLSSQRFVSIIGDICPTLLSASAHTTATVVAAATATVNTLTTVVATTSASDSVPILHPNPALAPTLPIIGHRGLFRSSVPVASKVASTSVDPYTLITGEDATDLSSPDTTLDSNLGSCFELLSDLSALASHLQSRRRYHLEVFGTATLIFVYSGFNTLVDIWVEPIDLDWIHLVPLPRLTPTESYFQLLGLDYIQVFAFLHLYPIWIALLYLSVSALFALIRSK